jgi:DNA polymerase-3 subunit gamma/tau
MAYMALYRKYRPKTFADIIGQDHITSTLINQLCHDKISHAYLFCGIRGTGKTSAAKVFAKALNCRNLQDSEPCGVCESCIAHESDSMPDIVEIDAASNRGIEEIRQIKESVKYHPVMGRYKVYIIDEVHMLTVEAFNALLKTLEEPPKDVIFILATTESQKLPATIISRTQRYDFRRLNIDDVKRHIINVCSKENIHILPKAAYNIAVLAEGALRDALSILDKCATYAAGNIIDEELVNFVTGRADDSLIFTLIEYTLDGNIDRLMEILTAIVNEGKDVVSLLNSIIAFVRDIIVSKNNKNAHNMIMRSDDMIAHITKLSEKVQIKDMVKMLDILIEAQGRLVFAATPIYVLECALLQIAGSRHSAEEDNNFLKQPAQSIRQPMSDESPIQKEKIKTGKEEKKEINPVKIEKNMLQPANPKRVAIDTKQLKEKLISKLYEKFPLIAVGVKQAKFVIRDKAVNIYVDEYVYSLINEDIKYKEYIINNIKEMISSRDYAVSIVVDNDIKKQAEEVFGDILTFEE